MKKLWLIVKREYLSRVRKKSFLVLTLLGPLLFAAMTIVPVWMSTKPEQVQILEVLDQSNLFEHRLSNPPGLRFAYFHGNLETAKHRFVQSEHDALLYIPDIDPEKPEGIRIFSKNSLSPALKNYVRDVLNKELYNIKLESGYDPDSLSKLRPHAVILETPVTGTTESAGLKASVAASMFFSLLTMFFIFIYTGRVMKAVIEEKSNRIVEVIISSVKPFQLMMGK
ncbi:MAG: ABC transporter permease, partial [Cytophagaceae bacterium]